MLSPTASPWTMQLPSSSMRAWGTSAALESVAIWKIQSKAGVILPARRFS
jgi:hypothetical protein